MSKKVFKSIEEYFGEHFKLLDLRIYRYILSQGTNARKKNPFRGMAVTEEEIIKIFTKEKNEESDLKLEAMEKKIIQLSAEIEEKSEESLKEGIDLRLDKLCRAFSLNFVAKNMIIAAMAVELDQKYERLFGYMNDNVNKKRATYNLVFKLLNLGINDKIAFRNDISKEGILKRFLFDKDAILDDEILLSNEINIHKRIIDYLFYNENAELDNVKIIMPRLQIDECEVKRELIEDIGDVIHNFEKTQKQYESTLFIYLHGDKGSGKKYLAKKYAAGANKKILIADMQGILSSSEDFQRLIENVMREGVLSEALVFFENFHCIYKSDFTDALLRDFFKVMEYFLQPIFISSCEKIKRNDYFNKNTTVEFNIDLPSFEERKEIWSFYGEGRFKKELPIDELASHFKFSPMQIRNSIDAIKTRSLIEKHTNDLIYRSCYQQVENKLGEKAVKIKPTYKWSDLILPSEQKELLKNACNQAKNKYLVYEKWGFNKKISYGKGLSIICSGPPGTGKTMSAQVIAKELNLELYRIDLSQVVSKYVGETEKNLKKIFEEANMSNAILFFDEADSLFGKRSDVKSSNDRYANIETSYLLQKIEEYSGISMMATNYLKNIDNAFMRRINYIIKYPFPDAKSREKIWKLMLDTDAPLEESIDYSFLAQKFELSGGNIKNCVIYAAFLAAEEGKEISMKHVLKAVKYELQKMDKLLLIEDFGEYKYLFK